MLDRLGLGYDELRKVNPRLVYVSNSGFGAAGPYRTYKTFGPIVQACCGLTFSSGAADEPPAGWGYSYMDHMGAYFMAMAVLAGLVERNAPARASGSTCRVRTRGSAWPDRRCSTTPSTTGRCGARAHPTRTASNYPVDGAARDLPGRRRGLVGRDRLP